MKNIIQVVRMIMEKRNKSAIPDHLNWPIATAGNGTGAHHQRSSASIIMTCTNVIHVSSCLLMLSFRFQ